MITTFYSNMASYLLFVAFQLSMTAPLSLSEIYIYIIKSFNVLYIYIYIYNIKGFGGGYQIHIEFSNFTSNCLFIYKQRKLFPINNVEEEEWKENKTQTLKT